MPRNIDRASPAKIAAVVKALRVLLTEEGAGVLAARLGR
jgi:hypothetical protein